MKMYTINNHSKLWEVYENWCWMDMNNNITDFITVSDFQNGRKWIFFSSINERSQSSEHGYIWGLKKKWTAYLSLCKLAISYIFQIHRSRSKLEITRGQHKEIKRPKWKIKTSGQANLTRLFPFTSPCRNWTDRN